MHICYRCIQKHWKTKQENNYGYRGGKHFLGFFLTIKIDYYSKINVKKPE